MKKVSIVVVDFNGHKDTYDFLKSATILDTSGLDLKTIVVDNGSDSPLPFDLERKYKSLNVEILQSGKNLGFSGGYNLGMKYALAWGAEYILIANNDTLFGEKKLIKKLIEVLDKSSEIGMVSPKIYFAKGFEFYKDRYKKSDQGKVIWYAGGYFDRNNVYAVHVGIDEIDKGFYNHIKETDFVSGCCLMIKASLINQIGYFEEKLFAYFEDVDFVLRARGIGYKSFYCGETYIYHKVSKTSGIGSSFTDYLITRNRLYVGYKYLPVRTKFALLREVVRILLMGRKEQKLAVIDFIKGKMGPPPWIKRDTKEKKFPKELSIVIVNYKTPELTLELLESIFDSKTGFDKKKHEVIILDNASNDGVGNIIQKRFPMFKFIQNEENAGFAKGYNKAISFCKGEYILLLNSDIKVLPRSIKQMLMEAKRRKNRAVIVGKLILPNKMVQDSCFNLPTLKGAIKEYFLGVKHAYNMYYPRSNSSSAVEGAVMASFLIPRAIWNEVGELAEKSFMYFEDIEYCRRLKEKGFKIYYCPKARFIHHHGASSKKIGNKAQAYLKKGAVFYHGKIRYSLLELILYLGQKWQKLISVYKVKEELLHKFN